MSEKKPGHWGVKDLNAPAGRARTHEAAPGHRYDLSADTHTWMPSAHAAAFLRDKAFEVVDEQGRVQASMPGRASRVAGRAPLELEPGQVLANLDELSQPALLARAHQKHGGENFSKNTKRDTLVEFLMGVDEQQRAGGLDLEGDAEVDAMDDEAAASLLEGR